MFWFSAAFNLVHVDLVCNMVEVRSIIFFGGDTNLGIRSQLEILVELFLRRVEGEYQLYVIFVGIFLLQRLVKISVC